ncbi:hypothetical protein BCIN_05g07890 [Botrytis cinerea B05.10]|uniref:Uncharacterized protein n=2 Tax=Botryotinia fuckeliana TaxID=40559 RepID=A0A384JJ61_BOTFB|nr:hypothetical protein BCIN_05g07890 [Botrytis cinerea B05.10]ATZ50437.1 hypothetical protein BCIN_05g07890 [Botrytis cinerea B05.10]
MAGFAVLVTTKLVTEKKLRPTQSVSLHSSKDQEHSNRKTEAGTQSHHLVAPSDKGKRAASKSPSSRRSTPEYHPVSPNSRGLSTSEDLCFFTSLQFPAYEQGNDFVEYEPHQPPKSPYRPHSPNAMGTYTPGFQNLGYAQQGNPDGSELYQPPQPQYYPKSPNLRGFTRPETESAPRADMTPEDEQPFTHTLDSHQKIIWGQCTSKKNSCRELQDSAAQRRHRAWESGPSNKQRAYINPDHSTTTAGGASSSGFNQTRDLSEIQSQMHLTSILDPNILTTSDAGENYNQRLSTALQPSSCSAGPSSSRLPEASPGEARDEEWLREKYMWDSNEHEMQQRYLQRYPADTFVTGDPAELRAHLLFAMSLGEGRTCNYRDKHSKRCSKVAVGVKRFFFCGDPNHDDGHNPNWYRGARVRTFRENKCFQVIRVPGPETHNHNLRLCDRFTTGEYCHVESHCDTNMNVPQPRGPL